MLFYKDFMFQWRSTRTKNLKMRCDDSINVLNVKAECGSLLFFIENGNKKKSKKGFCNLLFGCFIAYVFQKYICKYTKWRPLSHWLLCCHPETQPPCWALHLLMALVAAWVQTFPIFSLINFSSSMCLKILNGALSPWPLKHCRGTFSYQLSLKEHGSREGYCLLGTKWDKDE